MIDEIRNYIDEQSPVKQVRLLEIYDILKSALPNADEKMSYGMPTFWHGRNIIHFAAFKRHIGLFPGGEATSVFAEELRGFKTSKGTIQLPDGQPLPTDLIEEIAVWCGAHNAK